MDKLNQEINCKTKDCPNKVSAEKRKEGFVECNKCVTFRVLKKIRDKKEKERTKSKLVVIGNETSEQLAQIEKSQRYREIANKWRGYGQGK
ncbi:MAG: hypothetical protein GBAus27B_000370 [Mycoplasmataceae bacterium]|nr:MAG: hypothetical protein GBAus27B_000370 [Mycoplasmataceae bacterium]